MYFYYLPHHIIEVPEGAGDTFNESWSAQVEGIDASFSPILVLNPSFAGPLVANAGFTLTHILDAGWTAQFGTSAPFSPTLVYGLTWSGGIGIEAEFSAPAGTVFTESFTAGLVTNSAFNINLIIDKSFVGDIEVCAPFGPELTYGLSWQAPVTAIDAGFTLEGIGVILSWDAFVCVDSNFEGDRLREVWELIQAGAVQTWSPLSLGSDLWLPIPISASQLWAKVTTQ